MSSRNVGHCQAEHRRATCIVNFVEGAPALRSTYPTFVAFGDDVSNFDPPSIAALKMKTPQQWIITGAILAALAVVFGAFGAHGLEPRLDAVYGDQEKSIAGHTVPATYKYLQNFKTGADYHMYHAFGLLALGIAAAQKSEIRKSHRVAAWCFLLGIVLFSGSLYVLVLSGQRWLGAITPIGGLLMIAGWIAFAVGMTGPKQATQQN